MKLRAEQFNKHLQRELLPCYIISGDETLLVQESCDALRQTCRNQGFSREVFHIDNSFDWSELLGSNNAMSLFAQRQLIELRMPTGKPGDAGSKALLAFTENPNPDNVLLIISDKLDGSSTRSKWYKAIESCGASVQLWPIDSNQLPGWLEQRLRIAGLSAEKDAIQLLADRVEGNLLAAAQEIEKLKLYTDHHVSAELILSTVADHARFDPFGLVDRALQADTRAAIKNLQGLQAEGTDATLILWALARELRTLTLCAEQLDLGHGVDRVLQNAGVWDRRKPIIRAALKRLPAKELRSLMQLANRIDQSIKGMADDNCWHLLLQLVARFSGSPLPLARRA